MSARPPGRRSRKTYRSGPRRSEDLGPALVRLGRRVRSLRTDRGLTQAKLAEVAELDEKHLQVIERGETNVTVSTLLALAKALEVSLSEMFEEV